MLAFLVCVSLLLGCSDEYDDSALRNDLNGLENRVAKLEELCTQMNTNISSLQILVAALQENLAVTEVERTDDGYVIRFSDGTAAAIRDGRDFESVPVIVVKRDTDGIYYWTLDGEWLTDARGNRIKAQSDDGVVPQLKTEEGFWFVSCDGGKTWSRLDEAVGGSGGVFKGVTVDDDNVCFTLADGTVLTLPKEAESPFAVTFDTTDIAILDGGGSKTIAYTIQGATENTIVKTVAQEGWKAAVRAETNDRGTITVAAPDPIVESEILVFAYDGSYRTIMAALNCTQGRISVADTSFDVAPAGGVRTVGVSTNLDYTVEIPDEARSWLSVVETRAMRDDTIVFQVAENRAFDRFAIVCLKDERGETLQTVIFRQTGTFVEVHVAAAGELKAVMADYAYAEVESLKITGVLNDADLEFIDNEMLSLKALDISQVTLTTLSYIFYTTLVETVLLPATLTELGEQTLWGAFLRSIEIPASVEVIGDRAFARCRRLSRITFEPGSRLRTIGDRAFQNTPLSVVEIPASVETIGSNAFSSGALSCLTFESGSKLKTVGAYAFGSTKLTTIDMASCTGVEFIGHQVAFDSGSSPCLFRIGTRVPPVCKGWWGEIPEHAELQVPAGCVEAYRSAAGWSAFPIITELEM